MPTNFDLFGHAELNDVDERMPRGIARSAPPVPTRAAPGISMATRDGYR